MLSACIACCRCEPIIMECGAALGMRSHIGKRPVLGEKDHSAQQIPETLGMTRIVSRRDKTTGKVCV